MLRRCKDEKMWRWVDAKIRRSEDVKMRRCEDEKIWGCEDKKMWRCDDVKMWRYLTDSTIRRTLRWDALGKNITTLFTFTNIICYSRLRIHIIEQKYGTKLTNICILLILGSIPQIRATPGIKVINIFIGSKPIATFRPPQEPYHPNFTKTNFRS